VTNFNLKDLQVPFDDHKIIK